MDATEIKIDDHRSLALASDLLRDGEFSEKDCFFDNSRELFKLIVWKHDRTLLNNDSISTTNWYQLPRRRLELEFHSVRVMQIHGNAAGADLHPIGGLRWNQGGHVFIDTYDGKTIELEMKRISGQLKVTSEKSDSE